MATTYALTNTSLPVGGAAATQELALSATGAGSGTATASVAASAANVGAFQFTTTTGEPGQTEANWSGLYSLQLTVVSATSLTYRVHLDRFNSDASVGEGTIEQILASTTGTGIKTASLTPTSGFSAAATTASRFGLYFEVSSSDMMSAQNLSLTANTLTDSFITAPWTAGAPPAERPRWLRQQTSRRRRPHRPRPSRGMAV